MAGTPVGLLSELIVLINDNDNAVHDIYRTKSWTVEVNPLAPCKVYILAWFHIMVL